MLGGGAGLGLIVSEFLTLSSFDIGLSSCADALDVTQSRFTKVCSTTGHQHHHWALLALGVLALLMALGVGLGRSRPAALALVAIGAVAVLIAVAIDHPSFHKTHGLELLFPTDQIRSKAGPGYYVEIVAGVVAVLAGGLGILRSPDD